MTGGPHRAAALVMVLAGLCLTAPGIAGTTSSDPATAVQYFRLDPGTPTETGTTFDVPIFVLGEPAGPSANGSETRQAWQDLKVAYVGEPPGALVNWSVPAWGPGWFDLQLALTVGEVGAIEGGQALLALN
ncbi:MAG: hypothetical protein ACREDE_07690, partial [Thermoplasmata archaeon]